MWCPTVLLSLIEQSAVTSASTYDTKETKKAEDSDLFSDVEHYHDDLVTSLDHALGYMFIISVITRLA